MGPEEIRQRIENYWPNEQVLRDIGRIELLGTVGPSAVGKSTVTKKAIEKWPAIQLVLSDVSRAPRSGERDGVDYYFRPKDGMITDLENGDFVQVAPPTPKGDLYATRPESYPKDGIATLAIFSRAVYQFTKLPFRSKQFVFIVPASDEIWQGWFKKQARESGWSKNDEQIRLEEALESYEFVLGHNFITFVLNDYEDEASNRLLQAAKGQLPDDHAKAYRIATENYEKLKQRLQTG